METRLADCPLGAKCEEVKTENGRQILYRCPWLASVEGMDPNTGEKLNESRCSIAWLPMLMINTANESRKGAAATESFRNEMVQQVATQQRVMHAALPARNEMQLLGEHTKCE